MHDLATAASPFAQMQRRGVGVIVAFREDRSRASSPLAPSEAAMNRLLVTTPAESMEGGMAAKILVVDDQPAIGRAIARALSAYDTSIETDPRSAIRRFADGERFDIVLCDLEMPEMSGREVYDAFQREHRHRRPIMLMMSGHENVTALFAAGCPVLLKPFRAQELRALVAALLHENEYAAPEASAHGS